MAHLIDDVNDAISPHLFFPCFILPQGPMFDIATKAKNLTIAGFDLNCYVPGGIESKVFVYSLPGGNYGDNGNWHTKSRWDKVLETSISCNGFGTPTFVALAEGVAVPKNSVSFTV